MHEIITKFLPAGDKFMPEMHLRLYIKDWYKVLVHHSLKTKKEYKNLKKQYMHDIFFKVN